MERTALALGMIPRSAPTKPARRVLRTSHEQWRMMTLPSFTHETRCPTLCRRTRPLLARRALPGCAVGAVERNIQWTASRAINRAKPSQNCAAISAWTRPWPAQNSAYKRAPTPRMNLTNSTSPSPPLTPPQPKAAHEALRPLPPRRARRRRHAREHDQ